MSGGNRIRIGLLWHSTNSGNLGVGALTESNLALVREAASSVGLEPHFTVIGATDEGRSYLSDRSVGVYGLNWRALVSPSGYRSLLGRIDCILDIGGGDSFSDIYGSKAFAMLWLTKVMAVARGVPLILSPQTIGPFERQPHRLLAAFAMRRAFAIVARDPISYKLLKQMVPGTPAIESVDVAFALPFEARPRIGGEKIAIGVNVSGLMFNESSEAGNRFGLDFDYARLMRDLLAALTARPDVEVHLFCHVNSKATRPDDDDGEVADLLATEFPSAFRVPDFASPSDAKSFISSLDFVISGRMHACIAAFSSGVPVIPIAYSRKFIGLFEGVLGYRHLVPVKGLDNQSALRFILDGIDERAGLLTELERGNALVHDRLNRYVGELKRLFSTVGANGTGGS